MEIQVAKQYLEKALSVVAPGLSKESDISGHFVFRVKDGQAMVLTENHRVFSSCPIVCQADEDGGFTIEAKRLKQWLSSIQDAPLTLRCEDGDVTVRSTEGELPFQSLDPSTFPYWDETLVKIEEAHKAREAALEAGDEDVPPPVKFEIEATRLVSALGYVKNFISDRETVNPHLCVTEMKEGSLMATNGLSAAMIEIRGLEESGMRIHRLDIPATVSFLTQAGKEVVTLLESDRALVIKRQDDSLFGVTRITDAFPNLNQDQFKIPTNWWEVNPEDVVHTITFIKAAADWSDEDVNLDDEGGNIVMWMPAFHSKKRAQRSIECVDRAKEGDKIIKQKSFRLHRELLNTVLSSWKGKMVRFDLFKDGFVKFQEERDGDFFSTVLIFKR